MSKQEIIALVQKTPAATSVAIAFKEAIAK